LCAKCADNTPGDLHQVRAASLHAEPLRTLIHQLKYEDHPDLAVPLARYLAAAFATPDWDAVRGQIDAVVPIPMHPERRKARGYNQAELLAAAFCRRTGLPMAPTLLRREKFTRAQVGLNAVERQANVADAFVAATACTRRHLLLIDDVYTTGATLQACAAAAVAAGAQLVCGLTLAMPVH
jgi:ComF family protein